MGAFVATGGLLVYEIYEIYESQSGEVQQCRGAVTQSEKMGGRIRKGGVLPHAPWIY